MMAGKSTGAARRCIFMPPGLWEEIQAAAEAEERSASEWVRAACRERLRQAGLMRYALGGRAARPGGGAKTGREAT